MPPTKRKKTFLSTLSIAKRQEYPTVHPSDESLGPCTSRTVATKRRSETFQAAVEIHGADPCKNKLLPAQIGLLDTVEKKCSSKVLTDFMANSKKFSNTILPQIYNAKVKEFECSEVNTLRSLAVFYSKGVVGKRKYISVYQSLSMTENNNNRSKKTSITVNSCHVPKIVPYNKLIEIIKGIDLGNLYSVRDVLCAQLEANEKADGCYRDLTEHLVRLASFYLSTLTDEQIDWFGEPNTFQIAIGGDGAPFGKYEQSCAWLISFVNIGHRILSSDDNFLIFGSNCSEESAVVKKYISMISKQIVEIEQTTFSINNKNIKFRFSELPNDMKMLAFLAGELPNSATYFSTFANVSQSDISDVNKTFGSNPSNDWKPWDYEGRKAVALKVKNFKNKMAKSKLAEKTKRTKITKFIADNKSRQEFEPRIGRLISKAHVDPLHVKNNACQLLHQELMYESIAKSSLGSVSKFENIPINCPFSNFVSALQTKCHLSRLANKVIRWFNETKAEGKQFDYRFTGRDSRMLLHNFMYLIESLESPHDSARQKFKIHVFAFIALQLKNAVSIFCRMTVDPNQIEELCIFCKYYFRANSLFLDRVTPTVWTIGHVVYPHVVDVNSKYGTGLAIASMEGREAKHLAISRYSKNTSYKLRWAQIFRHEFISLIWLRERGYNASSYSTSKDSYTPERVRLGKSCTCGYPKPEQLCVCAYCSHPWRQAIELSCKSGTIKVDKTLLT